MLRGSPAVRARAEPLPARILYSADAAALVPLADPSLAADAVAFVQIHEPASAATSAVDHATLAGQAAPATVVIVDAGVDDAQALADRLRADTGNPPGLHVFVLSADADGPRAVAEALTAVDAPVGAVHVFSHGNTDGFQLGDTFVDADSLRAHADAFAQWANALAPGADLLLYGCEVAAGESGRALIGDLAALTGADVAASEDLTGSTAVGGDWSLEHTVGDLQTASLRLTALQGSLNLAPTSGETLVNDTGGGSHMPELESSGQVATNGTNTVVVWENGHDIRFRIYGANDSGGQVLVDRANGIKRDQPAVAMNASGDFVIVWSSDNGNGSPDVYAQLFAADGTPIASPSQPGGETWGNAYEFRVNARIAGNDRDPAVAMRDDGSFLVTWTTDDTSDGSHDQIAYRLFGASGAAVIGTDTQLAFYGTTEPQSRSRIDWDATNDRFAVSFLENDGAGRQEVNIRAVEGAGWVGTHQLISNPAGSGEVIDADVAVRSDGHLAVARIYDDAGTRYVQVGSADIFGGATGITLWTANNPSALENHISIVVGDDDAAVVVWYDDDTDGSGRTVFARHYDAAWTPSSASSVRLPQTTGGGDQVSPHVAVSGTDLTFVWSGKGDQPDESGGDGVFVRSYSMADPGLVVDTANGTTTTEDGPGNTLDIGVRLATAPSSTVTVGVSSSDTGEGTVSPATLTFTPANWNTPQTITVTGVRDLVQDGDTAYDIVLTATSSDAGFDGLTNTTTLTSVDTDQPLGPLTDADPSNNLVGELAPVGTAVGITASATDPNPGDSVQYYIDDAASPFSVGLNDGIVRVGTVGVLDHETSPTVNVTVRAQSGDGSSSSQTFAVTVTDQNDPPVGGDFAVLVQGNSSVTITMADIVYSDQDGPGTPASIILETTPGNGDVTRDGTPLTAGSSVSAADILAGRLAYSAPWWASGANFTTFTIQVVDDGGQQSAGASTVTVNANAAPVITSNGAGASASRSIPENTTAVTTVTVLDVDGPGRTFSIVGGPDQALFSLDAASGVLTFISAPDYESPASAVGADNIYDVRVRVEDGAGGSDEQMIHVDVTNVDEPPTGGDLTRAMTAGTGLTIQRADIVFADPEGEADAASILITALPANGALTVNGAAATAGMAVTAAQIDAGELVYTAPADAAGAAYGSFSFQVRDSAGNTATAASTITFDVSGIPVITSNGGGDTAAVGINENIVAVTTVSATDADGPVPTYALAGGSDQARFTIDPVSGQLTFNTPPNFEAPADADGDNVYEVTVQASDGGTGIDQQALTITVADVNEPPVTADGSIDATATVVRTLTMGDFPYTDPNGPLLPDRINFDSIPLNGSLRLDGVPITAGASIDEFVISAGRLTYLATDGATGAGYDTFQFTATGIAGLTSAAPSIITINVNGRPMIQSDGGGATATVDVAENTSAVTTVSATDPDGPSVAYGIVGGADQGRFVIDAATGALSFSVAPDAETPTDADADGVYEVTVRALDGLGGIDDQALSVNVTDVNEAPSSADFGVPATATVARTLLLGEFAYSDPEGTAVAPSAVRFDTVPVNGQLLLDGTPLGNSDVATAAQINLGQFRYVGPEGASGAAYDTARFSVIDDGGLAAAAPSTLTFDLNARPLIQSDGGGDSALVSVAEGTTAVTTVAAEDPDGPPTVYSIVVDPLAGPDATEFTIDPATGAVRFATAPDFENPTDSDGDGVYRVVVRADDSIGGRDDQLLEIRVTNVAEPLSLNAPATVTIAEDTAVRISDQGALSLDDPDAAPQLTLRLAIDRGTIALPDGTGLSVLEGTVSSDDRITVRGTPAQIQSALDGLRFVPAANDDAGATLQLSLGDPLSPGRGAAAGIAVQVTPVNDAPTVGGSLSVVINTGDTAAIERPALAAEDPDHPADQLVFTVGAAPSSGKLLLSGAALGTGDAFTQADVDAGRLTYVPNGADTLRDEIVLSVADPDGAGVADIRFVVEVVGIDPGLGSSPAFGSAAPSDGADDGGAANENDASGDAADGAGEDGPTAGGWFAAGTTPGASDAGGSSTSSASAPSPETAPASTAQGPSGRGATPARVATDPVRSGAGASFEYQGYRLSELDPFETLGTDQADRLAQTDRLWLDAPIRDALERTFTEGRESLQTQLEFERQVVASTAAVSTGVSIGYVIWLLRSGALISSILASMPAWRSIDPLPVLGSLNGTAREGGDSESLESMLDQANNDRTVEPDGSAPPAEAVHGAPDR